MLFIHPPGPMFHREVPLKYPQGATESKLGCVKTHGIIFSLPSSQMACSLLTWITKGICNVFLFSKIPSFQVSEMGHMLSNDNYLSSLSIVVSQCCRASLILYPTQFSRDFERLVLKISQIVLEKWQWMNKWVSSSSSPQRIYTNLSPSKLFFYACPRSI